MQIKTFVVPIVEPKDANDEMNAFLRGHKVISIDRHLVEDKMNSFWTFCVTYIDNIVQSNDFNAIKKNKIDYKEVLNAECFAVFSRLRIARKKISDREAIPAYVVFTDAELAEMTKLDEISVENIKKIQGMTDKRIEKYGIEFCRILHELTDL